MFFWLLWIAVSPKKNLGFFRLFLPVMMSVESLYSDGCAAHEFNRNFEQEGGDAGGGRGQEGKKKSNGESAELFKTWCARSVKFLHHVLFSIFSCFVFCVLLRIGYCCFRWVQGIPAVMYPTAWILFVVGGWRRGSGEGRRCLSLGACCYGVGLWIYLIRFGLCWDSFGSSVDAQCNEGFWNGDRFFDFVVHSVLSCVCLAMASIFPKNTVFEIKNSGWGLGLMCLFLSVLEMLIGMLIFVCQWVMKVVLLLSSNVWALFYMWGFFSLC